MKDKISIAVSRELHTKLKLLAVYQVTTLEKLVEELLRDAIGGNDEPGN
jgi:hypothetical protein